MADEEAGGDGGADWEMPPPHVGLHCSSFEPLEAAGGRLPCPACGKRRLAFCYDCIRPLTPAPCVNLPVDVTVLTHSDEPRSKNTGIHLAILAPKNVTLLSLDECPEYPSETTAVLFPCEGAIPADEIIPGSVKRVIVIDSRWAKAKALVATPKLARLRKLHLTGTRTAFWRRKTVGVPEEGVCTAEAVFFLCRSLHASAHTNEGGPVIMAPPGNAGAGPAAVEESSEGSPGAAAAAGEALRQGQEAAAAHETSAGGGEVVPEAVPAPAGCHCFDDLLWYFQFQSRFVKPDAKFKRKVQATFLAKEAARRGKIAKSRGQGASALAGDAGDEPAR